MHNNDIELGDKGGRSFEFAPFTENTMSVSVSPMLYYVKQSLGRNRLNEDRHAPLQIVFASGECGIALPVTAKRSSEQNENLERSFVGRVAVSSHPENSAEGQLRQNNLIFVFGFLALLNLIFSSILFGFADSVDGSKISLVDRTTSIPGSFDIVDSVRSESENAVFATSILIIFFGSFVVASRWSFGLTVYSSSVIMLFIFSMPNAPCFMYCFRYILDLMMLYVALQLKSHLVVNYISVINIPP